MVVDETHISVSVRRTLMNVQQSLNLTRRYCYFILAKIDENTIETTKKLKQLSFLNVNDNIFYSEIQINKFIKILCRNV